LKRHEKGCVSWQTKRTNSRDSKGLKELYIDELKDIYNAENQLVKALPNGKGCVFRGA
jgi:hypothetical protein